MEKAFWLDRWSTREIGFHEGTPNRLMVANWDQLALSAAARVFVPLCGKSIDIHWLLEQGHAVVGAEFSDTAIEELFAELGLTPTVTPSGSLQRFAADGIDIYCGDIFHLTPDALGPVDAIYDRAAMVALPAETRPKYAAHLRHIAGPVPHLLIAFDYDQNMMAGPPFAVRQAEIEQHFADTHVAHCLAAEDIPGGLKGQCTATEQVWKLTPRR